MSQPNQPRHLGKNAHYSIAFRRQAVQLVESGVPQGDVVQQLGRSLSTLKGWLQQYHTVVYAHLRRKLFTPAQQHQIGRELLDGRLSEEEALLKYDLRLRSTRRDWVVAFQAQEVPGPPPPLKAAAVPNEAAELAASFGTAHWQTEALHTLIDQAEAACHLDVRKKGWCQAVEIMRQKYPRLGVGTLCGLFGKTRNAFSDHQRRATAQALLEGLVLALVTDIRRGLPRLDTRKLYYLLVARLGEHAPQLGRDALFALLASHGLLIP